MARADILPDMLPNILAVPKQGDVVRFAPDFGQRFIVTVDTEEEFDWSKPLDRTGHGLSHVPRLARFQQFCEAQGVKPIYLIDYPVVTDPAAVEALGAAVAAGRKGKTPVALRTRRRNPASKS